jgi:CRISPR system Cascade subunit CasD
MSTDTGYLALLLDSPMQSWGFASRFQRRTTGLHPTKSGVIGLICAAMGLPKGSPEEQEALPKLAKLTMTSIAMPRYHVRRMEDFHTVLNTRRASSKMNDDPVVTRRQYLQDARFGVILAGDRDLLERVAAALQNPVWGVWFGRKNCIPAEPIYRGLFEKESETWRWLVGDRPIEEFTTVTEVDRFEDGTDSLGDQPVSFGDATSSGPDKRQFALRRIAVKPATHGS